MKYKKIVNKMYVDKNASKGKIQELEKIIKESNGVVKWNKKTGLITSTYRVAILEFDSDGECFIPLKKKSKRAPIKHGTITGKFKS